MGVMLHKGGGGRRRKRRGSSHAPMSEINVTPFVDVMLVLLIIFMITAPLLLSGIPVDLPTANVQSINVSKDPLTVTVDRRGKIYLGETDISLSLEQLKEKLARISRGLADDQVLFRGDRKIDYGRVIEILSAVHEGGFKKFTFVNRPEDIVVGADRKP